MPLRRMRSGSLIPLILVVAIGAGVAAAKDREEAALAREAVAWAPTEKVQP